MTATPVLARRALARLAFIIVVASALLAWAVPARADDPLATFFAQAFAVPPAQPGIIKPLRRHMRERAQGMMVASDEQVLITPSRTMTASSYGAGEHLAKHTANGEVFRPGAMTAAHRSLAFGTRLQVCHAGCVIVRITDRGPFVRGRALDLSWGAARAIGLRSTGVVRVAVL